MTAPASDADSEDREIYDPTIPRVDAVSGPAHGIPFHIIKAGDAGRLTKEQQRMADDLADTVADGVDNADTDPAVAGEGVDPEGDPTATDPGSPVWEAIDAAKARETLVGLTAVKQLIGVLADREGAEAAAGVDGGSVDNACDLDAAGDALDFALGVLAKYAVGEQADADQGMAEIEAQAEALGLTKALDAPAPVEKAGKVLSAQNQQALEQIQSLAAGVLSQLESAPTAAEGGEPVKVAKAADLAAMPGPLLELLEQFLAAAQAWQATQADDTDPETPEEAAPVADTDPTTPADAPEQPVQAATDAPADPKTPADPAPAAPADPSTAAPGPASDEDPVQKALTDQNDLIERLSKSLEGGLVERLTKSMTDAVEAAVAPLEERIAKMESTPAPGGPMLAGQLPGVIAEMRGQDAPAAPLDPVGELQKHLAGITDPQQRAKAQSMAAEQMLRARLTGQV